VAKQNALNEAIAAQADAQRGAGPDATPAEQAAAQSALNAATAKVPSARAELAAAEAAQRAAEGVLSQSIAKARDDGRKAGRDLTLAQTDLREARRTLDTLQRKQRLALSRVLILEQPANTQLEREIVAAAAREVQRARAEHARLAARSGVQVPADEILFFSNSPVRVDTVTATPGTQVSGELLTVSNTTLAIDAGLSPQDAKLVKTGLRVHIEDPETAIDLRGRVTRIADRPGTNAKLNDPTKTAIEVTPEGGSSKLVNASVRLTIAIKSTKGRVLTVPLSALSVGADGKSRVQVDMGRGRTRLVVVNPGLAAEGNVEIEPARPGTLRAGDRVVIGSGTGAAGKAPTLSAIPATPPGLTTPTSAAQPSGSQPATTAPATTTPAPATPATKAPVAPADPAAGGSGTRGP
jgi:hypothetical protein